MEGERKLNLIRDDLMFRGPVHLQTKKEKWQDLCSRRMKMQTEGWGNAPWEYRYIHIYPVN